MQGAMGGMMGGMMMNMMSMMGGQQPTPKSKGGMGGLKPGEDNWKCPKCGNLNFLNRTICNTSSCKFPKPNAVGQAPSFGGGADFAQTWGR
jgi:membrane protease subunit (stomatin/prohibitin family)